MTLEIGPSVTPPLPPLPPPPPRQPEEAPPPAETPRIRPADRVRNAPDPSTYSAEGAAADYGELPWEEPRPRLGVIARAEQLGLSEQGVSMMEALKAQGILGRKGGNGRTVGEEIVWRLEKGFVDPPLAEVLMGQLLNPDENIRQFGANTCAAATAQKAMAKNDPSLYFVTAADVFRSGGGRLPDGTEAPLSEANRKWIDSQDMTPDARIDATFQAALMDYANGADTYDLATDSSTKADGKSYRGLSFEAAQRLNASSLRAPTLDVAQALRDFEAQSEAFQQSAYGEFMNLRDGGTSASVPTLIDVVMSHVSYARTKDFPGVMVAMKGEQGQHMVLVSKVDYRAGKVTVDDGTGRPAELSFAQFMSQLAMSNATEDDGIGSWTSTYTQGQSTSSRGTRR